MPLTKKVRGSKSKDKKSITKTKTCKTKGLNIYKITNIFHKDRKCWDCAYGFIIIAKNESSARQMIYTEKVNDFFIYGDEEFKWIEKEKTYSVRAFNFYVFPHSSMMDK
jgi:hypothetical protein